jgi:hypothetical protein
MPISSKDLVVLIASISDSARLPIFEVREIKKLRRGRLGIGVEKVSYLRNEVRKGEGLPRLKAAAVPNGDNTSLPHHELIGRYVSCGLTRTGVAADILCPRRCRYS